MMCDGGRRPQQQQQQRRSLQCNRIVLFFCMIAAAAMAVLVSSIRFHRHGSINDWFNVVGIIQERITINVSTGDNTSTSITTATTLLLIDNNQQFNGNESTTRNDLVREWNSNTSIIISDMNSMNHHHRQQRHPPASKQEEDINTTADADATAIHAPRNASLQFQQLGCLTHTPMMVKVVQDIILDHHQPPVSKVLNMTLRNGCGPLRRDWRNNPPLSPMAQILLNHQSNCSLPTMTWKDLIPDYGIGSHLGQWTDALCRAWEQGMRLRTYAPQWIWLDRTHCNVQQASRRSPLLCYWPHAEYLCDDDHHNNHHSHNNHHEEIINTSLVLTKDMKCHHLLHHSSSHNQHQRAVEFHNAATEYMFRSVSPLVIREAHRQVGVLFGPNGAPPDLITVHLRWGDKYQEMKLFPIQDYIDAVTRLLHEELHHRTTTITDDNNTTTEANIYLATEDPMAADMFRQAAPKTWNIFVDLSMQELASKFRPPPSDFNCASTMAKTTRGRSGLVNVASILVGMEANYYVLTTDSGFSRIFNRLRTQILDPRCGNCTRAIDLSSGQAYWR